MDIVEAVRLRKSVRGYKPDPVPRAILEEILDIARRAPSAMNTQPWEITVISGKVIENIRQRVVEMVKSGVTPASETSHTPFTGEQRKRQVELAIQLFQLMEIAREDVDKRAEWMERGLRFFDAPAAIIISMEKALDESSLSFLDIGAITQTICLLALNHGLGTCIADQGVMYPDIIREFTGIDESRRLMICISIGYPDWDFPANKIESVREPLENIVTWCGDS